MTTSPPLFVELCAGTAALSLRLQARHARPPVSRMGAKTGYADAILAVMGLRPGQRAGHYLWCEPDPGCRLLLEAYRDRELAQAAADIIRGWKDEEPRALWERLRAEGPVKEDGGAREVGRWSCLLSKAYDTCKAERSGWQSGGYLGWTTTTASVDGRMERGAPELLAREWNESPTLPATIATDARTVDPLEVARWSWLVARSVAFKGPQAGYMPGGSEDGSGRWVNTPEGLAAKWAESPTLPASITADARTVEPVPPLPPGTIAYMDPPYVGTTGYTADLPRSEVVRLARLWSEAGARVYISEAEPLAELDGWHRVEITATRKGQKRTFSKQQAEWLTCSHPPAWVPAVQGDLIQWAAK